MNRLLTLILLFTAAGSALAMGGAPIFCVGRGITGLTVEGTRTTLKLNTPVNSESGDHFVTNRVMLLLHYGLLSSAEIGVAAGVANVRFDDLPSGFSVFDSRWNFAWGAEVRGGFPLKPQPYQVVAAVKYFGFHPAGETLNDAKTVKTTYLWHEITPTLTAGYSLGPVTPYLGVAKPYLFGTKDMDVMSFNQYFPAASGKSDYSDGKQSVRGIIGLAWRTPDGYSISGEAAAASGGLWTLSVGVSQVLK